LEWKEKQMKKIRDVESARSRKMIADHGFPDLARVLIP